jgi:nitrogen regulatory protein PII
MKEIKAYVRNFMIQNVVSALIREGFSSMTIIDVAGLGNLVDPEREHYSIEVFRSSSKMVKIELVCASEATDQVVKIIQESGVTHRSGDGIIFVSPVEHAIKIRTGAEGTAVLQT